MANFSNEEYADMMLAYGKADCNSHEARKIYQERYPNRRLPHHETFSTTYRRLRETGNLNFRESRVNVRQHNVEVDERILQAFDDDPTTSIRVVADGLNEPKRDAKKRGRPPAAAKPAKESAKSSDDEQPPVVKRGRGRPKGSKKKAPARGKSATAETKGRGRGRKEAAPPKKDASSEEEQDEDEEDEGSDE